MKIIVDAFGGDNAPESNVFGAVTAVNLNDDLEIVLVGDETKIKAELDKVGYAGDRIAIVHAPDVITNDDVPTTAIRSKKESSLVVALDMLKNDDSIVGMVSAGSTGAVLTGATLKVGRLDGVLRPTLATILPTENKKQVLVLDSGATADAKPEFLVQFAKMGSIFMSGFTGVEKPTIGLLSVGTEDHKGSEFSKSVFEMLKNEKDLNFVGNIEGRDIMTGKTDVVVADGFSGNIALKSIEGGANYVLHNLKSAIKNGGLRAKIGYLFIKKSLKKTMNESDYHNYGYAPFLGVKKIVVKAHGSSNPKNIYQSILQVKRMSDFDLTEKMSKVFTENDD